MKKYNEEYYSVIDTKTGRKIADCGNEIDAIFLVSLDSCNRSYTCNKFLMSQVIDIEITKQLPTNEIVMGHNVEDFKARSDTKTLPQIKLPEGQGNPIKV